MVWGMEEASGFGDYFLDGDYIGYKEAIESYYINEMSDAEKVSLGVQDRLKYSKFSAKFTTDLGALKPHEWPKEFRAEKTYKNLGSLVKLTSRLLAVDGALKEIIENFEPDTHQFSPIKITMPKGVEYHKQYYAMVISKFHDSFSPKLSGEGSYGEMSVSERIFYYVKRSEKRFYSDLALRREVFGHSHLWREVNLLQPALYFSDDLHAKIMDKGLRVPKTYQLKEV